jgi:hypothetical protein
MSGRRVLAALAGLLALASCGVQSSEGAKPSLEGAPARIVDTVCPALDQLEVEAVLGAPMASAIEDAGGGQGHPGCSWMSADQPDGPRVLIATVWRKARMEPALAAEVGASFYDDQKAALISAFAKVGALEGVGEEALMGLTQQENGLIEGLIVARKGNDVLSLSMKGVDASAFEAAGAKLAAAM